MKHAAEIVLNSWIYGVPLVLVVWAVLRLLHAAPARLCYVFVIAAFAAGIAIPLVVTSREAVAGVYASANDAPASSPGVADALLNVVDAMAFPLTLLWIAGAVALLLRECAGHLRLRRARRSWEEASDELRRLLEWPARIPLAVSQDVSPLTTGLGSPLVVLPRDIVTAFPLPVARRIALHELSHCRWHDPLVYAAMRVAASLFWISPLWLLLRWARREREVAADEVALRVVAGDEESYVAALVRFSRLALAHRSAASPMAASDLEFRAGRILSVTRRSSIALSIVVLSGAAALASVVEPVRLPREAIVTAAPVVEAEKPRQETTPAPEIVPQPAARPEPVKTAAVPRSEPKVEEVVAEPEDEGDIHVDVHVAMDEHVAVNRHVDANEHVAEAVQDVVREAAQAEVMNRAAGDEREVIRIVSVIRKPDAARRSRWRSFVNAVRGSARDPARIPD
jgi:beta-lactamase regulating signal transducer with metallopeptidase domain